MQFLVDAQLPRRLARLLISAGHDARHTLDLPRGNATADDDLRDLCRLDDRILVTKDAEFASSFFLKREPSRLLLVSTGNITNKELEALFLVHLSSIAEAFGVCAFVELDRLGMTTHV